MIEQQQFGCCGLAQCGVTVLRARVVQCVCAMGSRSALIADVEEFD